MKVDRGWREQVKSQVLVEVKEKDFVVNVGTAGPKQTGFLVASTFSSIKKKIKMKTVTLQWTSWVSS